MYEVGDIVIFQGWKDKFGNLEEQLPASISKGHKLKVIRIHPCRKFPVKAVSFDTEINDDTAGFLLRTTEVSPPPPEIIDLERFM